LNIIGEEAARCAEGLESTSETKRVLRSTIGLLFLLTLALLNQNIATPSSKRLKRKSKNGEPVRVRTGDLLIKSQLLYQLSYRPTRRLTRKVGRQGQALNVRNFLHMLDKFHSPRYMRQMYSNMTNGLPFMKMHGLGNDFVVLDARGSGLLNARGESFQVTPALAKAVGHRRFGVGFDQLAVITNGTGDAHLTFYNSDGSLSSACGNATRCIARFIMDETGKSSLHLTTDRGDLAARDMGDGLTSVNMGQPQLEWRDIPLAQVMNTLELPIDGAPTATGMGNPHCTFFVEDVNAIDLERFGPDVEHHPLYPERTNVQVAQIVGPNHIRMRVWERGVGVTLASGSSSCATAVAAARRGLTERKVRIDLDGGTLHIDWREDGVWMTGPTAHVFSGILTPAFLDSLI
jgi:diaminopimelate epimerase